MDLATAIRILLRRWLIVLIGLVLTLGAMGYLYTTSPPSYSAGARMLLLLPPDARGPDTEGSPFLYLPSGLNVIARLTIGATNERPFRQAMAADGVTSPFTATIDPQSPTIIVDVTDSDPERAIETRDWLVDALQEELGALQAEEGAPPAQTAHARVYAVDEVAVAQGGSWTRNVLMAAAAGGVITLVAAFSVDYLLQRRKQRRARRATTESTVGDDPVGSDPKPEHGEIRDETAEPSGADEPANTR